MLQLQRAHNSVGGTPKSKVALKKRSNDNEAGNLIRNIPGNQAAVRIVCKYYAFKLNRSKVRKPVFQGQLKCHKNDLDLRKSQISGRFLIQI